MILAFSPAVSKIKNILSYSFEKQTRNVMTSRSRRSVEKEKVSYVFMSLRRRALEAHGCTATWSWTCCSAALIIVSPLTDRNRSEAWLLPKCKQSSSQKSFLFFISLLTDTPPLPLIAPHPALLSHSATASNPLVASTAVTGCSLKDKMPKHSPDPSWSSDEGSSEKTQSKESTNPRRGFV